MIRRNFIYVGVVVSFGTPRHLGILCMMICLLRCSWLAPKPLGRGLNEYGTQLLGWDHREVHGLQPKVLWRAQALTLNPNSCHKFRLEDPQELSRKISLQSQPTSSILVMWIFLNLARGKTIPYRFFIQWRCYGLSPKLTSCKPKMGPMTLSIDGYSRILKSHVVNGFRVKHALIKYKFIVKPQGWGKPNFF